MFGMFGEEHDCTTQVEDYRLDNAGDYMRLVSSGIKGLGDDPVTPFSETVNSVTDAITKLISATKDVRPRSYGNWEPYKDDYGDWRYFNRSTGGDMSLSQMKSFRSARNMSGIGDLGCGENCDCACNKKKNQISGLGEINAYIKQGYGAWPPGPEPTPYQWQAPDGSTWTRETIDGKWMYRWSKDPRMYITVSNLYDLMGVKKDPETLRPVSKIPGIPKPKPPFDWANLKIGNIGAGWMILGAVGLYAILEGKK